MYAGPKPNTPTGRVLHFPKDRSLGWITVQDANKIQGHIQDFHDWWLAEPLGSAQGDVVIPAGKQVALFVNENAIRDLLPLLKLEPNDLYMLSSLPVVGNPLLPNKCMRHISHLAGLKDLWLSGTRTTPKGMKHITKLQSLDMLVPPKGLTNQGLSYIAQLGALRGLYFSENKAITNAGLKRHLPTLAKLEKLGLLGDAINDAGLSCLAQLPRLRYLSLNSGNFTDAAMVHVKKCRSLRILDLNHLPISDVGLRHLSGHPGLEELHLVKTKVNDRGLAYLPSVPSLKTLNVGKTQITDVGMAHVGQIRSLEHLDLPNRGITDKGLAPIANLKHLTHLSVGCSTRSPLTDIALKHVSKLQSLETLHIAGTGFTNAGMDNLAKLENLRELMLMAESITNEGLAKLKPLQSLEDVSLLCEQITISGLSHLNPLKNISVLRVRDIQQDRLGLDISGLRKLERLTFLLHRTREGRKVVWDSLRDEDLACLGQLKHLKQLHIGSADEITDAGIAYLKDLPDMRELCCRSPYLTDTSLSYLAHMKTLTTLTVTGNFTDDGLGELETLKSLRRLEVTSSNTFSPQAIQRLQDSLPYMDPASFHVE